MVKEIILIILLFTTGVLLTLDYIPVDSVDITPPLRDSLAFYHGESYDYFFYSQEDAEFIWAVHFDFTSYFTGLDSLFFLAQGAYIYIPFNDSDNDLKVKLCVNSVNQPGDELFSAVTVNTEAGWNFIPFPENTVQDVWLLVDYQTDPTSNFIAASAGDGTHSFYWEDNYYHNMSANGFNAEFLFDLYGVFLFPDFDIEVSLDAFNLVGDFENEEFSLSETIYPEFTIKNNTQSIVDTLYIKYERIRPDTFFIDSLYFYNLQPEEIIELDSTDTAPYAMTLLDNPCQYIFRATLYAEGDEFAFNNSGSFEFDTFNLEREFVLVENAVRLDQYSPQIWIAQEEIVNLDSCLVLNYFSNSLDQPFYNIDSSNRYHFYDLGNYPATIIEGVDKIIGYMESYYEEQFQESYSSALDSKGFVTNDSLYSIHDDVSNDVQLSLYLRNVDTRLFGSYLHNCTFYAVVVEDSLEIRENILGSVLLNIISEASCDSLYQNNIATFDVTFNLEDDVPFISNYNNCKLYFWIQNNEDKRIHYVLDTSYLSDFEFDLVTGFGDDNIQPYPMSVISYPNPAVLTEKLYIDLEYPRDIENVDIRIYNLKGQLVKKILLHPENGERSASWDFTDHTGRNVVSGIYFLKTSFRTGRSVRNEIDKIVLIRN